MDGTAIACKALLANAEVARFTLRFTHDVEPTAAQLQVIAEDVAADVAADLHTLYCPDITAFSISAQVFQHAVGPGPALTPYWTPKTVEFSNTVAIGPGTHAGESLPPQNAVVVTLRTALAGRSHLGRVYGFPPPEGVVGPNGQLIAVHAVEGLVFDIADATVTAGIAAGPIDFTHCVFSAKLNSATPVTTYTKGTRIDTQRRRLSRTG